MAQAAIELRIREHRAPRIADGSAVRQVDSAAYSGAPIYSLFGVPDFVTCRMESLGVIGERGKLDREPGNQPEDVENFCTCKQAAMRRPVLGNHNNRIDLPKG
jgi:hypothetical protein